MRGKKRLTYTGIIVVVIVCCTIYTPLQITKGETIDPFFTLVFKISGGGVRPDYGNIIRQHLARIGIDVNVIIQDWTTFVGELITFHNYDLVYIGLSGGGADPDFSGVYDENGSLNLFGYHTSMDWDDELGTGINEWYMKQGTLIMPPDSEERVQHYWDWEQYMMDNICPMLPTYTPMTYIAHWSNLKGYNYTDDIRQSWGKMYYDGSHTGQLSTSKLVISDATWSDLNPFFQDDTSSSYISSAVLDTLIWYDADLSVWPHLAKRVDYINDTTIEIEIREGIKWQSDPDEIYTNEYLDVNDVYFTLYSWKYVSNDYNRWDWIKDMEIVDQYTMIIYVDGDPSTPENDAYAPSLPALATRILPEHYLNQTQEGDGVTPDILHPSWNTYATAAFGTGPFKITSFTEGVETILTLREDYWGLNETITNDPNLNWEERWGFGAQFATNGLTQQRIRIIPDRQTAILEFEAGKIDIESVTDLTNKRYEMQTNPNFKVQSDLSFAFAFVGFNMRENRQHIGSQVAAPNDPEITIGLAVRKAICYAIDRVEMNNVIHAGEYQIVHWPIYPKMGIWCNPDIIQYNYNLNKAKEYMQIAGFDLGYTPSVQLGIPVQNLFNILTIITMMTIITVKKKV